LSIINYSLLIINYSLLIVQMIIPDWHNVRAAFQRIWGYDDFRSPQGEIIQCLLEAKDAMVVMPTGGGKSICFQLPALLQSGLTLVISPLIALMENQVQELQQLRQSAALLHSQVPLRQRKQILEMVARQQLRLLYVSPETLLSRPLWERISQPEIKINGLIIDEAHCLVQWGETFRPAYRRLGSVRVALLQNKPAGSKIAIAAFTATASSNAQTIIEQTLQLNEPQLFLLNPYRPNLNLKIQTIWTPKARREQMLSLIQAKRKTSGLVYVRSRKDSEHLAHWFSQLQYATVAYHAGLSPSQRRKIEGDWLSGKIQFVVCTSAFGMGINKPDVRWVIHFQAPQLLSEYLQEIGRGGRDGLPTVALTLISEPTGLFNPEDKQLRRFFFQNQEKQYRLAQQIARKIPPSGNVEIIGQETPNSEFALAILHSVGQITWQDPFNYQMSGKSVNYGFTSLVNAQRQLIKQVEDYFNTKKCRWQFLLDAFGFVAEAKEFRCGHCDNCRK
jgi:ATP-dependent DNA helicase RecQ